MLVVVGAAAVVLAAGLSRRASASVPAWVDPARIRVGALPQWADPRWEEQLAALFAAWPPFPGGDGTAAEELARSLGRLSFVEGVDPPRFVGRDGLELAFRIRRPVACVRVGGGFQTVARDGTLLPGLWSAPPRIGALWLPTIAMDHAMLDVLEGALPGDTLGEPEHLDALDVAASMADHLDDDALDLLGRVLIDASRGRAASPSEPGIRLRLEDQRLVLFGRPPSTREPGELPVARKWGSLDRALALLRAPADGSSWDLLDVRWDRPEIRRRGSGSTAAPGPAVRPPDAAPAARRPSRPSAPAPGPAGRARVR